MMSEFKAFEKIPRLNREVVVTEKIDGTNACVVIHDDGETIWAQSRTRIILPGKEDNFGFAAWVDANADELRRLGPGYHFGEWWGRGIQRGYGLEDRRFSLFNVARWGDPATRPACCGVVPVLAGGVGFYPVHLALTALREHGSEAVPGYRNPEGVCVYHTAAGQYFKVTLEGDESPKGAAK